MPDESRQWKNCPHCNRILWAEDKCDCPNSRPGPNPKPKDDAEDE